MKEIERTKMLFHQFFLFCFPYYSYVFVFLLARQSTHLIQGQTIFDAGEAFDHPHEEGDEHIVNKEVCSKEDLPEEIIDSFDRCTNFIPVYRRLDLLRRCRAKVFNETTTKNDIRKAICFNATTEHLFNECMTEIKEREGRDIPPPNPLQTMDFMFCMKTIAVRRIKRIASITMDGCSSGIFMTTKAAATDNTQNQTETIN